MNEAFALAEQAAAEGEIPIGAVIADREGKIIGRGRNRRESGDPLGHAELYAIREAAEAIGDWRLEGTTMVVTLEPCAMCAGAMILARLPRLVYATPDPKAGAAGSILNILQHEQLNHRVECAHGLLADEAAEQIRAFFRVLRADGQRH